MTLDEDARRGPWDPAPPGPPLAPGDLRRTTTIDADLPHRPDDRLVLTLTGRDVAQAGDGGGAAGEHASLTLVLDWATRRVESIVATAPGLAVGELRGVVVGPGFRARLRALAGPGHPATLSFSLLDQLPGAAFLVGYTLMADNPPTQDSPAARARFATRVDQCAGFTATGTIGTWITTVGHSPVPRGPRPPELAEPGAAGWHELPPLRPLSFRRARRLDVRRAAGRAEVAEVAAMFRDISVGRDGEPTVLHEYSLRATVDVARRTVVAATAQPRVLPWQECPAAAASARRVAGVALADLRRWVPAQLSGPSTCTHLNEALRALADVEHLLDWDPAGRERQSGP